MGFADVSLVGIVGVSLLAGSARCGCVPAGTVDVNSVEVASADWGGSSLCTLSTLVAWVPAGASIFVVSLKVKSLVNKIQLCVHPDLENKTFLG
jgi:hypothetical protein